MQELIDSLENNSKVDYLVDTCFFVYMLKKGKTKQLCEFCRQHNVGISSFNLAELVHIHHALGGVFSHHTRDFLKQRIISAVPVAVWPGERTKEKEYVNSFDPGLLKIVHDPSDAVLLVQALKLRADVLTRDKHHVFTTDCANHLQKYGVNVLKELPRR